MSDTALHLVKVPLRVEKLVQVAKRRDLSVRDLDDGYLAHCVLRELWRELAPSPFVLRGRGRLLDAWGYTKADAAALAGRAREFGDPSLLDAIDGVEKIASKEMPRFEVGRRVGFLLRACPVTRLATPRDGHRVGAEIDAFLARCFQVGAGVKVSREDVYRAWLDARLRDSGHSGVTVKRVAVAGFSRERLVRRTQGQGRSAKRLERPDVRFAGELVVTDSRRFLELLARGVGRHRAFGFGALIVVAPGTPYPRS